MTGPMSLPEIPDYRRFKEGVLAGAEVNDAHVGANFEDSLTRLSVYWFYVGAVAVSQYGCSTQEDFESFVLGAMTSAPSLF